MKFPVSNFRFTIRQGGLPRAARQRRLAAQAVPLRQLAIGNRQCQSGVALIVTLILLSVTLVMAVAFLAISNRERTAVSTTTDTATARLASDSALAAAQAQIAANIYATTNAGAYNYGLLVSTNFINAAGYDTSVPAGVNLTNVSYVYNDGTPIAGNDLIQNIANLEYLPRAPVYVSTNAGYPLDFRYYLDLNRDGRFEDTGNFVPQVDDLGNTNDYKPEVGDPQWIGVLAHPDQPHGPDNPFVARYAFIAQPIGNSLDLNHIHNQTLNTGLGATDGFLRNEGVGSWEINLAAFLADLNTNQWDPPTIENPVNNPYAYNPPPLLGGNKGVAFEDALSLLSYRYAYTYSSLDFLSTVFGNSAALQNQPFDIFPFGPLLTTNSTVYYNNNPANSWPGADNTNRFFSLPGDLFDLARFEPPVAPSFNYTNFTYHLQQASSLPSTYDRYTLYRMLSQMGTDSTVPENQMNLNYRNITNGVVVPGLETNLYPWTALDFFTNAADRMLRFYTAKWYAENPTNYLLTYYNITNFPPDLRSDGYGVTNVAAPGMTNEVPSFGLTNIPVYVNGRFYYSPAVNRLLQLAANMFDATTNSFYPSVFRPTFEVVSENGFKNVYINSYAYVDTVGGYTDPNYFSLPFDAAAIATLVNGNVAQNVNIYGVPWIIGVKKYIPGFNQFYLLTSGQASRNLLVSKPSLTSPLSDFVTNQMYIFNITNSFGCSFWNPYGSNYNNANLSIHVRESLSQVVSNQSGVFADPQLTWSTNYDFPSGVTGSWVYNYWPATVWNGDPPNTALSAGAPSPFFVPFNLSVPLMTNMIYRYPGFPGGPGFTGLTGYQLNVNTPQLPQLMVTTSNRLQAFILDGSHVIDYVSFAGPDGTMDLTNAMADARYVDTTTSPLTYHLWNIDPIDPSVPTGTPQGVVGQILVSRGDGQPAVTSGIWNPPPNLPGSLKQYKEKAYQDYFKGFFNNYPSQPGWYKGPDNKYYQNTELSVQAPYTPVKHFYQYTTWQANDPLVHFLASDLNYYDPGVTGLHSNSPLPKVSLDAVPKHSSAWGAPFTFPTGGYPDVTYLTQVKDSLIWRPNDWDFPTDKLPTVGWLGRVHRGTPWQTIYLKATNVLTSMVSGTNAWAQWTGDKQIVITGGNSYYYDAINSAPVQDRYLFDLFTARLNDNAVRGSLSVNQPGLASWSAMLSGVVALSNAVPDPVGYVASPTETNTIIQPAGPYGYNSPVGQIVSSIYSTRTNYVNLDGVKGVFEHAGDILSVPLLTEQSPFLNLTPAQRQFGISDQLYEWLPQQMLGLLHVGSTPRYVVYCYGQTLRPAPNGTVLSGSNFGLVTNYQVTAESAARAVIRVDRHVTPGGTNYTTTVESYNVLPPD